MMKNFSSDSSFASPKVSLFGVGGAGSNVLRVLGCSHHDDQCSIYSVNSDARLLAESTSPYKIKLGEGVTFGLGSGGDPSMGAKMARESESSFVRAFEACDVAIFVAGLGGGTGSGALPVMAKLAREMGVFLVSVVAMPFEFEGCRRREQAQAALDSVSLYSDIVMAFENDQMGTLLKESGLAHDVFAEANRLMARAVSFIPRLTRSPGLLHIGLDDLKSVLKGKGSRCVFGCGVGLGDDREICSAVFDSPLLKQGQSDGMAISAGADVLAHLSGGRGLTFNRVQGIFNELSARLPEGGQIHIGVSVSDSEDDFVELVVFSSSERSVCVSSLPPVSVEEEKRDIPPVQIITLEVDPEDELHPVNLTEDVPVEDAISDEEVAIQEDFEEVLPEPGEDGSLKEVSVESNSGTSDSSSFGKGRFDGDTPFLVDGEDFDLPPSMRRKR